jgi:hypothetical protein
MAKAAARSYEQMQVTLPGPVEVWEDVLLAADPVHEPTRARLRTLKKAGRLSDGINVPSRGPKHLTGSRTYFSSLWGWAERSRAQGFERECTQLEAAARTFESRYEVRLKGFLGNHALEDLPSASFYPQLMSDTVAAVCTLSPLKHFVLVAGQITDVGDHRARVVGRDPSNEPAAVDLPVRVVLGRELREGQDVWVLSRVAGSASIVEVLPAQRSWVQLAKEVRDQLANGWLQPSPEHVVPGLVAATARDYVTSAGARPSDSYIDELFADARRGRVAVHALRPAG